MKRREPRLLHIGAWWAWALLVAGAAGRTTNVLLLALLLAATHLVVVQRAGDTPWRRSYPAAVRLGVVIVVLRVALEVLFGVTPGATVVVSLPEVPLPDWAQGVRIGGAVTVEGLAAAFADGVRLATIVVVVGAANALSGPTRLLKSVPGALYEAGVAIVVALTLAPQLVADAQRVREARRLRGRSTRGARGIAALVGPVLDGSLRRSLDLAAAMDSRGYGRTSGDKAAARRVAALLLLGLVGIAVGMYGLLDATAPPMLGLPVLAVGGVAALVGLRLGGRRATRTRYRPDRWRAAEWAVTFAGGAAAALVWWAVRTDPVLAAAPTTPLTLPSLTPALLLAALLAAAPAMLAPPLPDLDADPAHDDVMHDPRPAAEMRAEALDGVAA
jgi:energy-coupling factor transport system permease protein